MLVMTVLQPSHAHTQSFHVLDSLGVRTEAGTSFSRPLRDAAGNLYDTGKADGDFGDGLVFKLDPQTYRGLRSVLVFVLQTRT
jgi:hypothetical protein